MTQSIQIFTSTDLHGEFDPFANSQTVKDLRQDFPESIWIDNGDFFIGNARTTYYNTRYSLSPFVPQANDFYDVMVPGNHDLDYGLSFLKKQVKKLTIPYVCCNLIDLNGNYIFEPYTIVEKNKLKIAVIGLMTEALPQLSGYENTKDLICEETSSALRQVLDNLPTNIDLTIVAYHGGLEVDLESQQSLQYPNKENQAYELATQFPEIDGLIAGHQHFTNAGFIHNCAFNQPGSHGNNVGALTFKQKEETWTSETSVYSVNKLKHADNPNFNEWLQEQIDQDSLMVFLSEYFNVPQSSILFKMTGHTRDDLFNAFSTPFSFFKYTFSKEEWEKITGNELSVDHKEAITIYTNDATLPQHRLRKSYVENLFDAYHQWLVN